MKKKLSDNIPFDKQCLQTMETGVLMLQAGDFHFVGHQRAHLTGPLTKIWPTWDPKKLLNRIDISEKWHQNEIQTDQFRYRSM